MRTLKRNVHDVWCTCSFKSAGWLGRCASSSLRWPRVAHQPKQPSSSSWQHFPLCFFACVVFWWHEVWAPFQGRRTTLSLRSLERENCFAVTRRCFLRTKSKKLFLSFLHSCEGERRLALLQRDSRVGWASIRKILALAEWELSSLTGLGRYWMPNR